MTKYNVTLDSTGPLITETGLWQGNDSALIASETQHFYDGTISLTDSFGASAYILFNGTAVYLYGSQGPLYGEFDVSIDGVVVHNGYSGQDELLFQQLLYSNATLPMGLHNVTITNSWTNAARNLTDIDYYVWTSEIGGENAVMTEQTIGWDNVTAWQYEGTWNNTAKNLIFPSGAHSTASPDASAILTFEGDAITVYGATSQLMGLYSVSLDSSSLIVHQARHDEVDKEAMIFYADNLGPGQHQLTFFNNPSTTDGTNIATTLLIDKAVITLVSEPSAHHSNIGVIVGAIVGGVLLIVLAVLSLLFWARRRRHSPAEKLEIDRNVVEVHPDPFLIEPFDPATLSQPSTASLTVLTSYVSAPSLKGQLVMTPAGSSYAESSSSAPARGAYSAVPSVDNEEPPPIYSS